MPKMKTNRGAAKRFQLKAGGRRLKRRRANRNHILTKNTPKIKLQRGAMGEVNASDEKSIKRMLGEK